MSTEITENGVDVKECSRRGCSNPPAPGRIYCSRECSPYGHLMGVQKNLGPSKKRGGRRPGVWKNPALKDAVGDLMTAGQIARTLGVSYQKVMWQIRRGRVKQSNEGWFKLYRLSDIRTALEESKP